MRKRVNKLFKQNLLSVFLVFILTHLTSNRLYAQSSHDPKKGESDGDEGKGEAKNYIDQKHLDHVKLQQQSFEEYEQRRYKKLSKAVFRILKYGPLKDKDHLKD